jgi:hypothetical protein
MLYNFFEISPIFCIFWPRFCPQHLTLGTRSARCFLAQSKQSIQYQSEAREEMERSFDPSWCHLISF